MANGDLSGHLNYLYNKYDEVFKNEHGITWNRGKAFFNFNPPFQTEIKSFDKGEDISSPNSLYCYTDGSKQEDRVGAGFVLARTNAQEEKEFFHKASYSLKDHNTVYQAEVAAIKMAAIKLTEDRHNLPDEITILTDSRSAIAGLNKHISTSKHVNSCLEKLRELSQHTNIHLRWIKAHVGHEGNEKADTAAKNGTKRGPGVQPLNNIPAPYTYLVKRVEDQVNKEWYLRWQNARQDNGLPIYRQTKHFFPGPDKLKAYRLIRQSKQEMGRTIQFITGHAFMRRHQNIVQTTERLQNADVDELEDDPLASTTPPTCRLCRKGDETPFHLIRECTSLQDERKQYFGRQNDMSTNINWGAQKLINFLSLNRIRQLMDPQNTQNDEIVNSDDELESVHSQE